MRNALLVSMLALFFVILSLSNSAFAAACGETITADTIQTADIIDCWENTGITIGADNIVLDCNGYRIDGMREGLGTVGIRSSGRANITIKNCVITEWVNDGILLDKTNASLVQNNNVTLSKYFGIRIFVNSSNNTIRGNIANNNDRDGIRIGPFANYNQITNNTANSNKIGFLIYNSAYNTLINNTANSNSERGIGFSSSANSNKVIGGTFSSNQYGATAQVNAKDNALINSTIKNSLLWDFFSGQNAPNNYAINLNLGGTIISFAATDVSLRKADLQPADPTGYQNMSKYINATNRSGTFVLYLNFSYLDSEVASINESSLVVARHNGTWNTTPAEFSNIYGVDEVNNVVFANITNFGSADYIGSIFAPLGLPDTGAPIISNVNAGNITNSSATITWDTNKPSNSTVSFGTNPMPLDNYALDPAAVKQHSINLVNLSANTLYYYNATSCNPGGKCGSAGVFNFTTAATSGAAPEGTTIVTETVPNGTLVTLAGIVNTTFTVPYGSSVDLVGVSINATQNLTVITGLTLPAGITKTAQVSVGTGTTQICVADTENATLSASCNQTFEAIVPCPGTAGNYTCSVINSTLYSVSNLTHSAIGSFTPAQNPANSNTQEPSSSGGGSVTADAAPAKKTNNAPLVPNNPPSPQIQQNPDSGSGNPNPAPVPSKAPAQNGITESSNNKNSNAKGFASTAFIALISKTNSTLAIIGALIVILVLGMFYYPKMRK